MNTRDYLAAAYTIARQSPDPSSQNGAVLPVRLPNGSTRLFVACNTFPDGVKITDERLNNRDEKLEYIEHAERAVIYQAVKEGVCLNGATLYCPWFACGACARAIILSGIKKVIGHKKIMDATPDRWKVSIAYAFQMFKESGVETELFEGGFPELEKIRFSKELWQP